MPEKPLSSIPPLLAAMAIAALPTTLLGRLQRFLYTDRALAASHDEHVQEVSIPTTEPVASASDKRAPEPAHIAVFEQAGTPASPIVRWATTSEPATACFNLERSTDGQTWRSVYLAAATGTAHRGASYSVPVQAAREGIQHFRVRQTLLDGRSLLSEVLTMEAVSEAPARVSIVPGRITDFLQLRLADLQPASITLRDSRGHAVTGTVIHGATARVDLGGVAPGIYFLHFLQAGMEEILRFEKE